MACKYQGVQWAVPVKEMTCDKQCLEPVALEPLSPSSPGLSVVHFLLISVKLTEYWEHWHWLREKTNQKKNCAGYT